MPEANKIEPVLIHKNALDVLAHQIAGILMDKETITQNELSRIIHRAYPYSKLTEETTPRRNRLFRQPQQTTN